MGRVEPEQERFAIQAVLGNYLDGFRHYGEDPEGYLDRDVTEKRVASLKRRIAHLDEKLARGAGD